MDRNEQRKVGGELSYWQGNDGPGRRLTGARGREPMDLVRPTGMPKLYLATNGPGPPGTRGDGRDTAAGNSGGPLSRV